MGDPTVKIKEAFRAADENKDGTIGRGELMQIFQKIGNFSDDDFDVLFEDADKNGDGRLQYAEFVDWVMAAGGTEVLPGVRYVLGEGHEGWPEDKKAAITEAMDGACALYNQYGGFDKELVAYYNENVPTADGNINGTIRFGGLINSRCALHEIAHTLGVGTHRNWRKIAQGWEDCKGNGWWTGPVALSKFKELAGEDARLTVDCMHFWPFGLNWDREYEGEESARQHIEMVHAFVDDLREGEPWGAGAKPSTGVYFKCRGDPTVFWSKSRRRIRKDMEFSSQDEYFEHRVAHLMPADWSHIEVLPHDVGEAADDECDEDALADEEFNFECGDFDTVDIGMCGKALTIIRATYGATEEHDYTDDVRALVNNGRLYVTGGIWMKIGDPEPGVPKRFRVTFTYPDREYGELMFQCGDWDTVDIGEDGAQLSIIKATYGSSGRHDMTDKVRALINNGRIYVTGGIWQQIGDPEPGVPKVFKVCYTWT